MAVFVIDITRTRGDDKRMTFTVKDSEGALVPINAWTLFVMAVHSVEDPVDDTTLVYSMAGVFTTDGTDSKIYFKPTTLQADDTAPEVYYYDAQALDANGEKCTFVRGSYTINQDRTKD